MRLFQLTVFLAVPLSILVELRFHVFWSLISTLNLLLLDLEHVAPLESQKPQIPSLWADFCETVTCLLPLRLDLEGDGPREASSPWPSFFCCASVLCSDLSCPTLPLLTSLLDQAEIKLSPEARRAVTSVAY